MELEENGDKDIGRNGFTLIAEIRIHVAKTSLGLTLDSTATEIRNALLKFLDESEVYVLYAREEEIIEPCKTDLYQLQTYNDITNVSASSTLQPTLGVEYFINDEMQKETDLLGKGMTITDELIDLEENKADKSQIKEVESKIKESETNIDEKLGSYLKLGGGTLTGDLTSHNIKPPATNTYELGTSLLKYKNIYSTTFTGDLSGKSTSSDKLTTPRTISFSGITATAQQFDGSKDITIPITSIPGSLISGTVASATNATKATSADTATTAGSTKILSSIDKRDLHPTEVEKNVLKSYFIQNSNFGEGNGYSDLLVLNTYSDSTGGNINALSFHKQDNTITHFQANQSATSWTKIGTLAYTTSVTKANKGTGSPSGGSDGDFYIQYF